MVLDLLQCFLPFFLQLQLIHPPVHHSLLVASLVQMIVLLLLSLSLLVLSEHSHDFLLDRVLFLPFTEGATTTLGSEAGSIPLSISRW